MCEEWGLCVGNEACVWPRPEPAGEWGGSWGCGQENVCCLVPIGIHILSCRGGFALREPCRCCPVGGAAAFARSHRSCSEWMYLSRSKSIPGCAPSPVCANYVVAILVF